jgi:hypothetical protein
VPLKKTNLAILPKAGLKLEILLFQLPKPWDYRCAPPLSAQIAALLLLTFLLAYNIIEKIMGFIVTFYTCM